MVPPVGWLCTREGGHGGPCAAEPMRPHEPITLSSAAAALQREYNDAIRRQLGPSPLLDAIAAERRAAFEALPRHRRAVVVARRRLRRSAAGRASERVSEAWGVLRHGRPEAW